MSQTPPPVSPPPQKKTNFILIGCLSIVILGVLLVGGVVVGGYFWVKSLTARYVADAPMSMPKSELTGTAEAVLRNKLNEVYTSFQQAQPVTLDLDSAELNAALMENVRLKDRMWVEIREGKLHGKISIPLDQSGMESLKGRWLNGEATFALSSRNGRVRLNIESMTVNGNKLPEQILEGFRQKNLVEDIEQNAEAAEYIRRIESLQVEDDHLRVHFKPGN